MLHINLDRPSPIQFELRPEATPGEKRLLDGLHEWAKTQQSEILSQIAAVLEVPKGQLVLGMQLDWSRIAPEVQSRAERAAASKLPVALYPEARDDAEFKMVVRTKDLAREVLVWEGTVTEITVPHPELIPAQFGALQSDISFGAIKRLNQWCAQNLDQASVGLFRLPFGEQKLPIFTAIASFSFAKYYWSDEQLRAGYRISTDFEFAFDSAGRQCLRLTQPNSDLDPKFTPNLDKRIIVEGKSYLLVELLSPQPASTQSPDRYEEFIDAVFKSCNRGKAPSDLRSELRQFGLDASMASPEVMSGEQLQKLGLKAPDAFKTESRQRMGVVGQEKTKVEGAKSLRALMQAFGEDPSIVDGVKSSARSLIMPMISSIQRGQKPDPKSFEKLGELLPGAYAPEIERLKSSLT